MDTPEERLAALFALGIAKEDICYDVFERPHGIEVCIEVHTDKAEKIIVKEASKVGLNANEFLGTIGLYWP